MAARQLTRKLIIRGYEWRTTPASSAFQIHTAMHSVSEPSKSDPNAKNGGRDELSNEQVVGRHLRGSSDGNEQGTNCSGGLSATNANVEPHKATFECSNYWKKGGLERRHWMEEDLLDHQDPLRTIGFCRETEENCVKLQKVSESVLLRGKKSSLASWQQGIWGGIGSTRSGSPGLQGGRDLGFGPKLVRFSSTAGEGLHNKVGDSQTEMINIPNPALQGNMTGDFGSTHVVAEVGTATVGMGDLGSIQAVGEVAAATVDCSYPTAFLQHLIDYVHIYAGLPWWASIVATTLAIRLITLPAVIFQIKSTARIALMRPELEEINNAVKDSGYDPKVSMEAAQRLKGVYKKYQFSPISPFLGAGLQAPVFLCFFFGIKNMAERVESFKEGGILWFTDLTIPDSTYILPILTAASFLITVEVGSAEGMEGNPMGTKMKNVFRALALLMLPISSSFESALFCYWFTSNIFSLFQGIVLRRKNVKLALGIPETSHLAEETAASLKPAVTLSHRPRKVQGVKLLSKHVRRGK